MPDNMTEDEAWLLEVENAKHEIKRNLLALGGLIGQEDARQFVENEYPFQLF